MAQMISSRAMAMDNQGHSFLEPIAIGIAESLFLGNMQNFDAYAEDGLWYEEYEENLFPVFPVAPGFLPVICRPDHYRYQKPQISPQRPQIDPIAPLPSWFFVTYVVHSHF